MNNTDNDNNLKIKFKLNSDEVIIHKNEEEKEKKLLELMGWKESTADEISDNDIKQFKNKWKEITYKRENFRQSIKNRFQIFLSNQKEIVN